MDVQGVVQRRVVTRDVMDAIPSGNRSWASMAVLVPGAKVTGGANVGGTTSPQAAATIHGSRSQESMMLFDGMRYNQGLGTGGSRNAFTANDGNVEQISFETAALSAGARSALRPQCDSEGRRPLQGLLRDQLHESCGLQSDNRPEQRALVASSDSVEKMWDFNPAIPIVQDKMWFFSAFRNWGYERRVANRFFNLTRTDWRIRRTWRTTIDTQKISANLRLTTKVTEKSKLSLHYENQADLGDYRCGNRLYFRGAVVPSTESQLSRRRNGSFLPVPRPGRGGWTFVNNDFNRCLMRAPTGAAVHHRGSHGRGLRNTPSTWGHNASHQTNVSGAVSYVTDRTFKTRGIFLQGT